MKPSIDQSLIVLAQELSERVAPLIDNEYELSRLKAWSALLLIASSINDDSADYLLKENKKIEILLEKYRIFLQENKFFNIYNLNLNKEDTSIKISSLKKINENLRTCFTAAHTLFEEEENIQALKDSWEVLSTMQMNQGVNRLLPLLQVNKD